MIKEKDHKVTIKQYGVIEWFDYHSNNNLLFIIITHVLVPIIVSFITTLIVLRCN